jgi:CelD/BcsL family acetyltransferase involved in cellulose biosynthesis
MEPETDNRLAFRTIRDLQELEALRGLWESWPGTRDSDLDFFSSLVRSRGQGCQPHVIVLIRGANPNAILIGLRERRRMPFKLGFATICEPEVTTLEFVYGGLRGKASKDDCSAFVQEVMRFLNEGQADLALWRQLDVQSNLCECALRLPHFVLRDHSGYLEGHWFMNFPQGLDEFLMSLDWNQRSKLRRKYRKVTSHLAGKVRTCSFHSVGDLEPAISDIEEIASRTDKRLFGEGFFNTLQMREQMVASAERGWLRLYILYLEGQPAAFWVGTLHDHCLQADHVGYDPVWSKLSPGIFLFFKILEDLRDEDIAAVDLGCGDIQFKQCFGDLRSVESSVHIYAPTLRGIQLNLLCTATHRLTVLLRHMQWLKWPRRALWRWLVRRGRKRRPNTGSEERADAAM